MPQRETSKQRSVRIPLDYYKRADGLTRWRNWLSVGVLAVGLFWLSGLGWDVRAWNSRAGRAEALATHGTLARVHATWDAQCEACHVPFQPIDGSSWSGRLLGTTRQGDRKCQACHAGPAHHKTARDEGSCASCHRDHRGRDVSLVAETDGQCTRCHASLTAHMAAGTVPGCAASVTAFGDDPGHRTHPEFALFRNGPPRDPGTVKFNHALHTSRGLNPVAGGKALLTYADLPDDARPFYQGGAKVDEPVQLRCDSCHRLDGEGASPSADHSARSGSRPSRGGGSIMRPVRYETQCRACHPLGFDDSLPAMRHGLQPAEVSRSLRESYAAGYVKEHPQLGAIAVAEPARQVPGRAGRAEVREARETITRKVAKAERVLFGEKKCGECHAFERAGAVDDAPAEAGMGMGNGLRVTASNIPEVWLPRAFFDHTAHRAVDCRGCHGRADANGPKASVTSADVMIPAVTTCQSCHAPRSTSGAGVTGGAGSHCTECHHYHNGDAALQGRGSLARDAKAESGVREFLRGVPARQGR